MRIKVFDIVNPDMADEIVNDWLDELDGQGDEVEIVSVAQSESAAANDFFHLTITVVWQFRRPNTASTPTNGGLTQADNLSTPAAIRG